MITNGASATQRAKIERFHLAPYFDHILVEGELGFGKPEPEVYLKAMAALRSSPADTWCVGDNLEWEVAAPQRLGIYSVWVDPTGAGPPPGSPVRPDRTVASIGRACVLKLRGQKAVSLQAVADVAPDRPSSTRRTRGETDQPSA